MSADYVYVLMPDVAGNLPRRSHRQTHFEIKIQISHESTMQAVCRWIDFPGERI